MQVTTRLRFTGRIAGFGTASGRRVVIGHWPQSPFGSFTDCMVEDAAGHRTLLAPTEQVADFVEGTYSFDEVRVVPVAARLSGADWSVDAGPLMVQLRTGRRTGLGWALRGVPPGLATSTAWAATVDPVARTVLRGVRTRVTAKAGDREWYGARDQHLVVAASASWDAVDCGAMTRVEPPVRFGPGSTPSVPSVVDLVSTVERG